MSPGQCYERHGCKGSQSCLLSEVTTFLEQLCSQLGLHFFRRPPAAPQDLEMAGSSSESGAVLRIVTEKAASSTSISEDMSLKRAVLGYTCPATQNSGAAPQASPCR